MAKRHSPADKRQAKRQQLIERTAVVLSCTQDEASALLSANLKQAVRLNPLKGNVSDALRAMRKLGWRGTPVVWCENGYTIDDGFEILRDSKLVSNGKIYIQNQSSWLPVVALSPVFGDTVLDICAAPGGKTSHIAAFTGNSGRLVANDNSKPRLAKLQRNLERLGANAEFTLADAVRYSHTTHDTFDKILLDAPCSGEGLINLAEPKSLDSWSVAHIRRLATLQKRLINQAWLLLRPGGRLVYSTCTMAPEENEAVIDWFLRRHDNAEVRPLRIPQEEGKVPAVLQWNNVQYDPRIAYCYRLKPAAGNEAFFVCVLEKQVNND